MFWALGVLAVVLFPLALILWEFIVLVRKDQP